MFVQERQDAILSIVNENGKVLVKDLSQQFDVTEDCIRKDLAVLEKKSLLKRAYGGAVSIRINSHQGDVAQRRNEYIQEKRVLAHKALTLIKERDTIFLDISTANVELAKLLIEQNMNVTVVTNMVDVIIALSAPCNVSLFFIGGSFNRGRDGFIGSSSIGQISQLRCDLAFMGTVGVDSFNDSVYTYVPDDGLTKKAILRASRQAYLLVEKRKFNMEGNFKYAELEDFQGLIIDDIPDAAILEKLKHYEIEVL
ncbi:DeoR/GlpR family DNA-binding transcription regulator [Caproiciproducens sp. R2]|uniref:DeoR/GlpR family DNA-binding transcription regulator n=1 Tax=Caproiciproducens sp. R2 TaxID=3435187 RepID=UPI004034EC5F